MNGQIQYGSARPATSLPTPAPHASARGPDPGRFAALRRLARPLTVSTTLGVAFTVALVAVPRETPGPAAIVLLGCAWVSLMLGMTLPSRSTRARTELAARVMRFRHAVNAVGDAPTRVELEGVLALARELGLQDEEAADDLERVHASLAAATLKETIEAGGLRVLAHVPTLAPGDNCYFHALVRCGRRRSDHFGHLLLSAEWCSFKAVQDVSVAWTQVVGVQRAGRTLIVTAEGRRRPLRVTFKSVEDAARAGVIADHLHQHAHRIDSYCVPFRSSVVTF